MVIIEGESMCPTLKPGDKVLIWRYWPANWLRREQIIVLYPPYSQTKLNSLDTRKIPIKTLYIKRIIGLSGDILVTSTTKRAKLLLPEQLFELESGDFQVWDIPPKHFFVRGDSPGLDSYVWGPISFEYLYGVFLVKLPWGTTSNQIANPETSEDSETE